MAVIEIYLNNEWVVIEPYNAITFDFRYDEVFDSGKFTFESTTIDYNIPPCTFCKVDNEFWFVSSICNKIIPSTSTYVHDAELLEVTFALHQVIIGTKMLSNNGNYPTIKDKIGILLALANQKCSNLYGTGQIAFAIDWTNLNNPNLEREFQFGKGTSLFQTLLEIGKSVNCIPYVFNIDLSGLNALIEYQIGWINLNDNNLFELEESKIIKLEMYQDVENYTQVLESEIDNVVDRDTINYVYNLTVTSNDAVLSSNNQILKLPSNIESIVSMQINSETYGGIIRFKFSAAASLDELYGNSFKTLEEWNSIFDSEYGSDFIHQAVLSLQDKGFNISMNSVFHLGVDLYAGDTNVYHLEYAPTYPECKIYMAIPITDRVLEYSQWCMLDAPDQNKYFVYTKYSDTIENLYQRYKDDLYNEILGNNVKEPLYYAFQQSLNYSANLSGVAVDISVSGSDENTDSTNPINSSFNIAYKVAVSTFIKSTNNKSPFNESAVKSASKSFELSASLSDFNLLVDSINKVNDMTGMPELTIEYNGSTIPNLGDYIIFKNKKYYITSMQQTILLNDYTTYINLVSSFNKVAEVFGVASHLKYLVIDNECRRLCTKFNSIDIL